MASHVLHIPIDKFGRIVLPKEIRDRLGIREGTEFEIEERNQEILLRPVPSQVQLVKKDGWLVIKSKSKKKISFEEVNRILEDIRHEREKSFL